MSDGAPQSATKFLGKFRGVIVNNLDPMQIGRIQAIFSDASSLFPTR